MKNKMNNDLPYLQRVKVSYILKSDPNNHIVAGRSKALKVWSRVEAKETAGVIIGRRRLCNGVDDYFTAYLVSFNMRDNPAYCLPTDVEATYTPLMPVRFRLGLPVRDLIPPDNLSSRIEIPLGDHNREAFSPADWETIEDPGFKAGDRIIDDGITWEYIEPFKDEEVKK